jgi:hypothetical protein
LVFIFLLISHRPVPKPICTQEVLFGMWKLWTSLRGPFSPKPIKNRQTNFSDWNFRDQSSRL